MNESTLHLLGMGAGLISGLIATYVSVQNRALLAEVWKELAELENRIIARINGTYARESEVVLREQALKERIERLEERNAAGH